MAELVFSKQFEQSIKSLPPKVQEKMAGRLEILRVDPFDSRLHTKHLAGKLQERLSFRITRAWRVIFEFIKPDTIHVLKITQRKDAYR